MFARLLTNQIQPNKMDEWIALVRESIIPELEKQKGFKGFVVLSDPATGKGIGYSTWETVEDLEASEARGMFKDLIARLGNVLAGPPVREVYNVTVLA